MRVEINRKGCTRIVLLTKRYAVKIPNVLDYRLMLYGLLANLQEAKFARTGWPELCPIRLSLPLGLCVVMERVEEMTREQWDRFDAEAFCITDEYTVPVELKMDSFGWLNGKPVAIDYGN